MMTRLPTPAVRMASSLQRSIRSTTSGPLRRSISISTRQQAIPTLTSTISKNRQHGHFQIRRNGTTGSIRTPAHAYSTSTTNQPSKELKADDCIQEIQDLYEIAKDELEIAAESTAAATIYAASDRVTLREAFDDLDRAYAAYTGTTTPSGPSTAQTASDPLSTTAADAESGGVNTGTGAEGELSAAELEADAEEEDGRTRTNYDPRDVAPAVREEIKKRVGQRVREMRSAVQALEESAQEG